MLPRFLSTTSAGGTIQIDCDNRVRFFPRGTNTGFPVHYSNFLFISPHIYPFFHLPPTSLSTFSSFRNLIISPSELHVFFLALLFLNLHLLLLLPVMAANCFFSVPEWSKRATGVHCFSDSTILGTIAVPDPLTRVLVAMVLQQRR